MEVISWKLSHGLVIFFSSRHARSVVKSIFHCYVKGALSHFRILLSILLIILNNFEVIQVLAAK